MKRLRCPPAYVAKRFGPVVHVYDPVLQTNFYAVHGGTHEEFRKVAKRFLQLNFEPLGHPTISGKFYSTERNRVPCGIIWTSGRSEDLVHECVHAAAWALMLCRDTKLTESSEEVYAYYQAFLFRSILGAHR